MGEVRTILAPRQEPRPQAEEDVSEQTCIEPSGEPRGFSITATFNQGALTGTLNRVTGTGCCMRRD